MKKKKNSVRSNSIYEELKRRIINLDLPVGYQLVEEAIAEEFSASRTPVRQALQRLAADNIITITPYVGCTVRELTVADIDEIYTIRMALEGICTNRATPVISVENLDSIEQDVLADLRESEQNGDASSHRSDLLHRMVLDVGGNGRIRQIMDNLNDQLRWCHNFSMRLPGRFRQSCLEHQEILAAMRNREAEEAERLMRRHLSGTQKDLTNAFINARFMRR